MFDRIGESERERLIDALYEVVLHPEKYDALMELWSESLTDVFGALDDAAPVEAGEALGAAITDQTIDGHFSRALAMLEKTVRIRPETPDAPAAAAAQIELAADGRVLSLNSAAEALFGADADLDAVLDAAEADDAARMKSFLAGLSQMSTDRFLSAFTFIGAEGRSFHFAAFAEQTASAVPRIALRALSIEWTEALARDLGEAFGLSPAELDVVRALAFGASTSDIARNTSRSLNTIRTQIKSALKKTRSSTQADLVRLIALLAQVAPPDHAPPRQASLASPDQERLRLPDGRTMELLSLGAPNGRPFIFIHGMLAGATMTWNIAHLLHHFDLRMICPVRAGFGGSDPIRDPARAPLTYAEDLTAAMDHLGVRQAPVLALMSGAVYAFAAASLIPGRFSGLLIVSGGVPITNTKQFSRMAPRQRVVAYTARYTPHILPTILRAGVAQLDEGGAGRFMRALYPIGCRDREVIDAHGLSSLLGDGYRFSVRGGWRGFAADAYHVVRDWTTLAQSSSAPATHLHGALDPVVSIESVRAFCAARPASQLVEHADAGQLLFYQKPRAALNALTKLV